jgi:hypothetical protein
VIGIWSHVWTIKSLLRLRELGIQAIAEMKISLIFVFSRNE